MLNSFRCFQVISLLSESALGVSHQSRLTMTLLCATGMSSNVLTLRGRLHRSACWLDLNRRRRFKVRLPAQESYSKTWKLWSVMLTPRPAGCRSGAEPPGRRHSGVCSRCSWGQGSLECLQPPRLPSVGCSPSHPVHTQKCNYLWLCVALLCQIPNLLHLQF